MNKEEKLAYMAGWFSSDGCLMNDHHSHQDFISFTLKGSDKPMLDIFSEWFGGKSHSYTYKRELKAGLVDYETCSWRCYNKDLVAYIKQYDLKNRIPNLNPDLLRLFLRGFFEGDGCIGTKKSTGHTVLVLSNQSKEILEGVQEYIHRYLDIEPKALKLSKDNFYQISYESRVARLVAWFIYKDAKIDEVLLRKAIIANKLFGSYTDPILNYFNIILIKPTEYLLHNDGFMFRLYQAKDTLRATKMVCAGFKILGVNATPVPYGKGKEKYFGVYIPSSHIHLLVNTQDFLIPSLKNCFKGKIKLKA
jgi:hypothetical protein